MTSQRHLSQLQSTAQVHPSPHSQGEQSHPLAVVSQVQTPAVPVQVQLPAMVGVGFDAMFM